MNIKIRMYIFFESVNLGQEVRVWHLISIYRTEQIVVIRVIKQTPCVYEDEYRPALCSWMQIKTGIFILCEGHFLSSTYCSPGTRAGTAMPWLRLILELLSRLGFHYHEALLNTKAYWYKHVYKRNIKYIT